MSTGVGGQEARVQVLPLPLSRTRALANYFTTLSLFAYLENRRNNSILLIEFWDDLMS